MSDTLPPSRLLRRHLAHVARGSGKIAKEIAAMRSDGRGAASAIRVDSHLRANVGLLGDRQTGIRPTRLKALSGVTHDQTV
jgi:hypothetical protein